jgi:hypothetical protein
MGTVRLTLRTLLAYLDDTLEPMEIKRIGQKVSESDAAQELIARIKQITRRRRLTTPPATGPSGFDPNTVAEYLDNELPAEQVAELEKLCLESDVHLAEIASCHQILTLVLGEPALVPPTAKERMYGLVHGREAIPFRKAAAPAGAAPTAADADADEMFLLGLPFYRRGSWLRWALPLAGVFLLVALGVALWQATRGLPTQFADNGRPAAGPTEADREREAKEKEERDRKEREEKARKDKEEAERKEKENKDKANNNSNSGGPNNTGGPAVQPTPVSSPAARQKPPSTERAAVGSYHFDARSLPSVLVERKADEDAWHRLTSGGRIFSHDRLVSLPGYASEVRLDSGVHLLLRGNLRELAPDPAMAFLQECAVVLHHTKDLAADLTLDRGRLYVSNHKDSGAAVVRLRFGREVWDLTLEEPGTEVVLDLVKRTASGTNAENEEPLAALFLVLLQGKAGLAAGSSHYPNLLPAPGPALVSWDNKGTSDIAPRNLDRRLVPLFDKVLPVTPDRQAQVDKVNLALKEVSLDMRADKVPSVALQEVRQKPSGLEHHAIAIYGLGAIDDVKELLRVLGDTDYTHAPDRDMAIFALRFWLGRDAGQGRRLYDNKTRSGLLLSDQEYRFEEAKIVFDLLHGFDDEQRRSPETFQLLANYLLSDKVAIAELAWWHLRRLVRGVKLENLNTFNAAAPREYRDKLAKEVKEKIEKGQLPPRAAPGETPPTGQPSPPPKKQ